MNKVRFGLATLAGAAALALLVPTAGAHDRVTLRIDIGTPFVPSPVVVLPPLAIYPYGYGPLPRYYSPHPHGYWHRYHGHSYYRPAYPNHDDRSRFADPLNPHRR